MKLLADECCAAPLVKLLRDEGHNVLYVMEDKRGATDDEILNLAHKEQRILLTEDKDFGELVYRLRYPAHAILLLRFDPTQKSLKYTRLLKFLNDRPSQIIGAFVVLEADKVRIRPLTPP